MADMPTVVNTWLELASERVEELAQVAYALEETEGVDLAAVRAALTAAQDTIDATRTGT